MKLPQLIAALDSVYGPSPAPPSRSVFELVLFENIAYLVDDERRRAAFDALRERVGLRPGEILAAAHGDLFAVARIGGMHPERRVETLRRIARLAIELGDLTALAKQALAPARKAIQEFPALGEPGAEKVLLFSGAHPVLALESNGLRVLLRVGIGMQHRSYAATYRAVREALGALPADRDWLINAHQQLRRHGQRTCRRSAPLCPGCVLKPLCNYATGAD